MHNALHPVKCQLHATRRDNGAVTVNASERLKLARERAGYATAKAAADAMGIAHATYTQHENGTRGFPAKRAERYARFFRVAPEWLLYGKGDPGAQPVQPEPLRPVDRYVPVIGEVQAGAWAEIREELVPQEFIPVLLSGFAAASLYALRVRGTSMDKYYPDGTMVVVCPAAEIGIREGDHVVVRRTQGPLVETTIKEVVKERSGVVLWPRSNDPAHQTPIRLPASNVAAQDGPEIIGVVVANYTVRPIQQRPLLQL